MVSDLKFFNYKACKIAAQEKLVFRQILPYYQDFFGIGACITIFFLYIFHNKPYLYFMFGDLGTTSFANMHFCDVNFLECKSSLIDVDTFKYYRFGNTNECLALLARQVST